MGRVGIGLDAQFANAYPDGMETLCEGLRGRLSHVSIVSLRTVAEADRFRATCAAGLPVIHHLSGVEPAGPAGPDLARYALLDAISVALDAKWSCEDIAFWSLGGNAFPYFTPPLLTEEAAEHTARGIRCLQEKGSIPFVAEVPSFTVVAGDLSVGDYFARLTRDGGCDLVADVAHVFAYAVATGRDPGEVFRSLPLERVREVHVAGGRIDPAFSRRYLDTHSDPVLPPVLALARRAAEECPRLAAVTYEIGVGLTRAQIDADLENLEQLLAAAHWSPAIASA